ncbi:helix-turn-helix domain-containing protein [Amycolatopsis sp. NPDC102389]|uniref:AraC family transcriptional regulator n=1 Tax=Amycolatopsis sp. NPDC102389 TaxID=3363941 RepID=UPI00381EA7B7
MGLAFESADLDEIEEFVSAAYTTLRLRPRPDERPLLRIIRNPLGPISMDLVDWGFGMDAVGAPLGSIDLVGIESGTVGRVESGCAQTEYGPGEMFLIAQPDRPFAAQVRHTRYSHTTLEPSVLCQVAATVPGRTEHPVRLTGDQPISPAAARHLMRTITFLRDHVMPDPTIRGAALVASTAPQLLAATVLSTFPNSALIDPTIEDRHDSHPATLRRAMAFIDDHAHLEISVADIAAAANVTIRALQYAFRRHRGTTPLGYLREVRLHHAHQELLSVDPAAGVTVTEIGARWGFFHPGRFAHHYRSAYGCPPYRTLQRDDR